MTNKYNKFIVQSNHDISQFESFEYAKKHAALNAPASIYCGEQVAEIIYDQELKGKATQLMLHANNSEPIITIWEH